MSGLSPKLPLNISTEDGAYGLNKTYQEMVRQNFLNLILTNPGERIMDPIFGVGIRNFLFDMNNPSTYSEISSRIYNQVSKYLPFIEVSDVSFNSNDNNEQNDFGNYVYVRILYRILPLGYNISPPSSSKQGIP